MSKSSASFSSPKAAQLRAQVNDSLSQGQFTEAVALLEQIVRLEPHAQDIHAALGSTYFQIGDLDRAIRSLKTAVTAPFPRQVESVALLAVALTMVELFSDAIPLFEEVRRAGVRDCWIMWHHAESLNQTYRFEEARAIVREAAKLYPDDFGTRFNAATSLLLDGFNKEALTHAERAAALKSDQFEAQVLLAQVRKATGDHKGAGAVWHDLLIHQFDNHGVHAEWMRCLTDAYGSQGAISELEKAIAKDPRDRPAVYQLARHFYNQSELDGAAAHLSRCEIDFPPSEMVAELRARLQLAHGDIPHAVTAFEKIWDSAIAEFVRKKSPETRPPEAPRNARRVAPAIYMPIEIKTRELGARVLTACFACEEGLASVLSWTRTITPAANFLPPGIFLHKTLSDIDKIRMWQMLSRGHVHTAIDEEALGWTGPSWAMVCDVQPESVALVDRVFLPGARHAAAYSDMFSDVDQKIRVTGNPRFDLLNSAFTHELQSDADKLRQDFGPFILVCTNFGTVNAANFSYRKACDVFLQVTSPPPGTEKFDATTKMGKSTALTECTYIHGLENLLPAVASMMPHLKFVIRAHPGESDAVWLRLAAKHGNIAVESGGSLQAWMRAADAVIHVAGCTTGLEAHLAGVPALRYMLDPSIEYPYYGISAHINRAFGTADELAVLLGAVEKDVPYADRERDRKFVAEHISIEPEASARRVAHELRMLYDEYRAPDGALDNALQGAISAAMKKGAQIAERRARVDSLAEAKRVSIAAGEVEALIEKFKRAFGISTEMSVVQIDSGSVLILPKTNAVAS